MTQNKQYVELKDMDNASDKVLLARETGHLEVW